MPQPETEPYVIYLAAASANPGPSACVALITRGEHAARVETTILHATYAEALAGAAMIGVEKVAGKAAPIRVVSDRRVFVDAAHPWAKTGGRASAAVRESVAILTKNGRAVAVEFVAAHPRLAEAHEAALELQRAYAAEVAAAAAAKRGAAS